MELVEKCLTEIKKHGYKWLLNYDIEILDTINLIIAEVTKELFIWGEQMCDKHVIMDVPLAIGGGTIKKADRKRRRCRECWQELKARFESPSGVEEK